MNKEPEILDKCTLLQACEWIALGWKPITTDNEFLIGRIRPKRPKDDINSSEKVKIDYEKYKKQIIDASLKIKDALRDNKIQARGKLDKSLEISKLKDDFKAGLIEQKQHDREFERLQKLHDNRDFVIAPPKSFYQDEKVILLKDDEDITKIKTQKDKSLCSSSFLETRESKINPFFHEIMLLGMDGELSFFTNRYSGYRRVSYYDLEFSFPALEKAFPYKETTTKERLMTTEYTTPYIEIMLEVIEQEKLTKTNQSKKDVLKAEIIKKMQERGLEKSESLAGHLATAIRTPEAAKGKANKG